MEHFLRSAASNEPAVRRIQQVFTEQVVPPVVALARETIVREVGRAVQGYLEG